MLTQQSKDLRTAIIENQLAAATSQPIILSAFWFLTQLYSFSKKYLASVAINSQKLVSLFFSLGSYKKI